MSYKLIQLIIYNYSILITNDLYSTYIHIYQAASNTFYTKYSDIIERNRMSISEFQILSKLGILNILYLIYIGDGAYSSVYKVVRIKEGLEYALKKVKMQNLSAKEKENALNEVRILASINSPNVVAYKEAFIDEPSQSLWYTYIYIYIYILCIVLLWNLLIMETCSKRYVNTRRIIHYFMKLKYGLYLYK